METLQVLSLMSKEKEELQSKVNLLKTNLKKLKATKEKSSQIKDEKKKQEALQNYKATKEILQNKLLKYEKLLEAAKTAEKCQLKNERKSSQIISKKFMTVPEVKTKISDQAVQSENLCEKLSIIEETQKKALLIKDEKEKTEILMKLNLDHSCVMAKLMNRKKNEREKVRVPNVDSTAQGKTVFHITH